MTKHYRLIDWYRDGCISEPPHCVLINLDRIQVWELFEKLVEHLRFNENNEEVFQLSYLCELEPCGSHGQELTPILKNATNVMVKAGSGGTNLILTTDLQKNRTRRYQIQL